MEKTIEKKYRILDFKGEFNNFPELYTVDELLKFLIDCHIIKEIRTEKQYFWKGTNDELIYHNDTQFDYWDYRKMPRGTYHSIDPDTFNTCLAAGLIEEREVEV